VAGPRLFFLAFAALFALFGAAVAALGALQLLRALQLRGATPDRLVDATAGERVRLLGRAERADETLAAPFSGGECLSYDCRLDEFDPGESRGWRPGSRPDDTTNWRTAARGGAAVPFLLTVDGGAVLVRGDRDPSLDHADDRTTVTVEPGDSPPERVRRFVEGDGPAVLEAPGTPGGPALPLSRGVRRRYVESRLEPGERAFVAGYARRPAAVDGDVPAGVELVVGPPPDGEGPLDALCGWLGSLPFTVADAPPDRSARRRAGFGAVLVALGVPFVVLL
jgi:hypothetical protein